MGVEKVSSPKTEAPPTSATAPTAPSTVLDVAPVLPAAAIIPTICPVPTSTSAPVSSTTSPNTNGITVPIQSVNPVVSTHMSALAAAAHINAGRKSLSTSSITHGLSSLSVSEPPSRSSSTPPSPDGGSRSLSVASNSSSSIFPPGIQRAPSPGYKKPRKEAKVISKHPDYLKMILTAPIYDLAKETPLHFAEMLSARVGNQIYLKREDMQPTFSFKIRGSYNRLKSLTDEERAHGVVCASAGNHAQGVALSAKKLGIKATIVMPRTAPEIKSNNVRRLGGTVVLHGVDLEEARGEANRLSKEFGYVNIPPFDDPYIIAGQGTIAVEIMRQIPHGKVDAIFVCCGGGGMLAGIATYIKRLFPEIKVIGVEEVDQNSMCQALAYGHPVTMPEIDLFADGTAVRRVGDETFRLVQEYVDEMVLVSNDEVCAAIKDVFGDTRSILEPSGALSLAGCKRWIADNGAKDGTYVAITSGANMGFDRLQFVAERAEIGEETEALISVLMPEKPGSFLGLLNAIMPRPIRELSYRYHRLDCAHVFASIRVPYGVPRDEEVANLLGKLAELGMSGVDISKNEFAKSHARYLVGGRTNIKHERLVRSEFRVTGREMIRDLLAHFSPDFNQLMFHYKNQGGDVGKVLMGFEVPPEKEKEFNDRLEKLSTKLRVAVTEETDNVVYRHFMVGETAI